MLVSYNNDKFFCICSYKEKDIPKGAGFRWMPKEKQWQTKDITIAESLSQYLDEVAKQKIRELKGEISNTVAMSSALSSNIEVPCPEGLEYMPFQKAAIEYGTKHQHILISDEQGTGKTIEAIGITNILTPKSVFIICPSTPKIYRNIEGDSSKMVRTSFRSAGEKY